MAAAARLITPLRVASRSHSSIFRAASPLAPRSQAYPHLLHQPRRSFSVTSHLSEKKYTEEHEWIELSPDGKIGTIGITSYASRALGDVVYVELPSPDLVVSKGDTIGAVESVKSASDIMTPVSGKIVEINGLLEEKPAFINKGPEGPEGWLCRIEVEQGKKTGEIESLMAEAEYARFVEGEEGGQ